MEIVKLEEEKVLLHDRMRNTATHVWYLDTGASNHMTGDKEGKGRAPAPPALVGCNLYCPSSLLNTARVGEALPADLLHHKHHVIMLLIPSTTPPYFAGQRRRIRWFAAHVHRSEAPFVVALGSDGIARRIR
jgi:hypothetical protein